ncbi:hypothetical protein L6164_007548 [Bauhinia variegata]|uniref:Uncharacterized protein n=1 Tax=Bauhinia variegata TaxID=167791 RepID=A0ACB9PE48_BAUVA|nr:hypothetical protein L6164_007548 [Bauhinia variegata]
MDLNVALQIEHMRANFARIILKSLKHSSTQKDLMVSPVTKGILARGRKGGALLPPGRNQPKVPITACSIALPLESFNLFGHCIAKFLDLPQEVENQEPMEID